MPTGPSRRFHRTCTILRTSGCGVRRGDRSVRHQDAERQPDELAAQVGQHRSVLAHRLHPPRLLAPAVLHHAARHRQVPLHTARGDGLRPQQQLQTCTHIYPACWAGLECEDQADTGNGTDPRTAAVYP